MKKSLFYPFLMFFGFLVISFYMTEIAHAYTSEVTIEDENLLVFIEMDGINIINATEKTRSILIDPTTGVLARLEYIAKGEQKIEIDVIKTVFVFTDLDVLSKKDTVDATLSPSDNFTFIQTWKFNNYVGNKQVKLITGIYSVRYDLYYKIEDQTKILKAPSFYVRFSGNPLTSVFGIVSSIAVIVSGFSFFTIFNSLHKSIPQEINKSIESSKISPTKKLMGYYKGKSYSMFQAQVSNAVFGYLKSSRRSDTCPKCESNWPKDKTKCPNCMITNEEAAELYVKSLVDKTLDSCKEVVDSVSGLSLSNIVRSFGKGETPTSSIISVMTFSGLTLIKPRVSNEWKEKTRKLTFTGLRTSIYSLFWIQACGIGTLSLVMLVISIISGLLIPILISTILANNIKAKARDFWQTKLLNKNEDKKDTSPQTEGTVSVPSAKTEETI
jgi:hypothetical protein